MPLATGGAGAPPPLGKRGAWAAFQHRIATEAPRNLKRSEALRRKVKGIHYRRVTGR